jgi:3-oxoacyl-ACP reductase-like protein
MLLNPKSQLQQHLLHRCCLCPPLLQVQQQHSSIEVWGDAAPQAAAKPAIAAAAATAAAAAAAAAKLHEARVAARHAKVTHSSKQRCIGLAAAAGCCCINSEVDGRWLLQQRALHGLTDGLLNCC